MGGRVSKLLKTKIEMIPQNKNFGVNLPTYIEFIPLITNDKIFSTLMFLNKFGFAVVVALPS